MDAAYRSDVKDFERADPGGIVASQEVVEALEREAPELAACARPLDAAWVAPDGQGPPRATYTLDDVSAGG